MKNDLVSLSSIASRRAVIGRAACFFRRFAVFALAVAAIAACGGGGGTGTESEPEPDSGAGGNTGALGSGGGSSSGSTFPGVGTCTIAGAAYASGAPNPANVCQICAPASSTTSWSSASDGTTCGSGEVCNAGSCFSSFCDVGGTFYASGAANPSNSCQSCDPLTSTSAWTAVADGKSCGAGDACHAGSCEGGCGIGGVYYAPGAIAANGCQSCQPAASASAWSNVSDGTLCAGGSCAAGACAVTFGYTATAQSFTVPPGVTRLFVLASGASGQAGTVDVIYADAGAGGLGATVTATIPVTAGEALAVYVGGTLGFNGGAAGGSADGWVGGRGGDASDVRQGGSQLASRVVVAAGGGGGGASGDLDSTTGAYDGLPGGGGGGATGQSSCSAFYCGQGGSATAGGAAGGGEYPASPGSFGYGGVGESYGGGGGGGYYGGGGGCPADPAGEDPQVGVGSGGGGGGSSYVEPSATAVTITPAVRSGVGQVVLSY